MTALHPTHVVTAPSAAADNADLAALTAAALSRFVCDSRSEAGNHVANLTYVLNGYARTDACVDADAHLPPPEPRHADVPARTAKSGREAISQSFDELRRYWDREVRRRGVRAALSPKLLDEFFSPSLQHIASVFIREGPAIAKKRVENYITDYADQTLRGDVSKESGAPSRGARLARQTAARAFMRQLVLLRQEGHPSNALAPWVTEPIGWKRIGGSSHTRMTVAVPGHTTRHALFKLNAEIGRRLRVTPGDFAAEYRVVAALKKRELVESGLLRLMRKRQALILTVTLGTRASATTRLRRCDLDRARVLPDGSVSPALRVFEWKQKDRDESIWKPVPAEMVSAMDSYMAFVDRYELLVKDRPCQGPETPLILSEHGGPMSGHALRAVFSGSTSHQQAALLRKEGRSEYAGYSTHNIRSRTRQWIDSREGRRWLDEQGVDRSAEWIAEATLGHNSQDLKKLYGGASKPEDVELLSAYGAKLSWLMLTTDLGTRKVLDLETYQAAVERRVSLEADKARLRAESSRLRSLKLEVRTRRDKLRRAGSETAAERETDELERIGDRLGDISDEREELSDMLDDLTEELVGLETDADLRRLIPDDVPAAAVPVVTRRDLKAVKQRAYDGDLWQKRTPMVCLREPKYVSIGEMAALDGRSEDFFKRLLDNKWPSQVRGVEPWDRSTNPLALWSTPRRRCLLLSKLNPRLPIFTDPDKWRHLDELLATHPQPEQWGREWAERVGAPTYSSG